MRFLEKRLAFIATACWASLLIRREYLAGGGGGGGESDIAVAREKITPAKVLGYTRDII
jgi:hypothetical protein